MVLYHFQIEVRCTKYLVSDNTFNLLNNVLQEAVGWCAEHAVPHLSLLVSDEDEKWEFLVCIKFN